MELILPNQKLVLKAFSALADLAPGTTKYADHVNFITASTQYNPATGLKTLDGSVVYVDTLNTMFGGVSTADLATAMLSNLGLSSIFTQAEGVSYLSSSANRVKAVLDLAEALSTYAGANTSVIAAKDAYNSALDLAYNYSITAGNTAILALNDSAFTTFTLTTGLDKLTGTAGIDTFVARTVLNANTLQDADTLDGGAGNDSLYVDLVAQANAITPKLTNIENVIIRAQTTTADTTNGNNTSSGAQASIVQIDAQRSLAVDVADTVTAAVGVTRWESNNSRSDVVIEDVRIGNTQKTSDVTIAMVETDPGNVDFAVYFDQHSLRNAATGSTSLTINLMDTGAAGAAATAATPLLNNPYDQFKLAIGGVLTTIQLDKTAVAAADTYEALLTVFQTALAGSGVTVALGANFTVTDPISNKAVVGKSIVITGSGSSTITAPTGSGWFNTTGAAVPATSNIYTTYTTGSNSVTELVTSKVVLDDVGRGSTGGDLVIGGQSTGDTSTSRGVERFEITVNDNSKLQTINSTNNALREVTIVNGLTSKTVANAYTTTVTDEGDLTVNGDANALPSTTGGTLSGGNNELPGVENNSPVGIHHGAGATGFTDVRLIDASAFKGKLAFTAAITKDTIAKYVNLIDVAPALPAADVANNGNVNFNVKGANFIYTGGIDNDTMTVTIDATTASSRSSVISGQSDFTFAFNGGAGDDAMTVTVINTALAGGAQAWYNNQKLNANIAIGAGDGDDTIRTPGAGDVIIDAGTGNDTVYTDNTGTLIVPVANGAASASATAYANAAAAELAAGLAANVASNTTGFVMIDGTATGAAVTTAAAATALNTLNLISPAGTHAEVIAAGGAIPVHSVLIAGITAAAAAGGLTLAQANALQQAYGNWSTAGVVTPAATMIAQTLTTGTVVVDGTVVTAAQYDAGNALLETYIAAAKAAAATATGNDAIVAAGASYDATGAAAATELLNVTQKAVVVATQAVNRVYDPVAGAVGLTYTPVVTQGANETNTFTIGALAAAATTIINGVTYTGAGAGATAAQVQAVVLSGVGTALVTVAGVEGAGFTKAAGAGTNVVWTSTATGNPANLADTGTSALAVTNVGAVTETVAVTIAGTGVAGETVTIDGITHAVGGLTAAAVAALIDGAADTANFTDAAVGAVVTFTSTVAGGGVATDLVVGAGVGNPAAAAGTQTTVNNLAALNTALAVGATDAQVVTALQAAINNGSITVAQAGALFTAATAIGVNSITAGVAGDRGAIELILTPLQTAAANANTAAQATLTTALAADVTAVNLVSTAVALNPNDTVVGNVSSPIGGDEAGAPQTAAAVTAATAAVTAAQAVLTPLTTQATNLAALKAAIAVNSTDLQVVTATSNAVANGAILAGDKIAIDAAAGAAVPAVAGVVVAGEKTAVDLLITALQVTNDIAVASNTKIVADLQAIVTTTTTASTIAAAAAASGGAGVAEFAAAQKAVYVFDTSNQAATYVRQTADDRNLADLKSDANNSNNFFNSTLKVTYKGIDSSVTVAGTGYKTTDLELNQSIKLAINSDAVLSKLLLATDGPANTLVVTSLIDGVHVTGNLAVSLTMPATGALSAADIAGAATAYGLASGSTEAQVLAAITAAKTAFDAKGDYTTQFAESGAANGNVTLVGANSTSSSDNTITLGTGNDVLVLGTTVGTDLMTSSNEKVIYSGLFGSDTIVNFAATGLGIDMLDFTALNGRGNVALNSFSLDKSIVIAAPTAAGATVLSAAQIAALFTDSATAINHVYVAVDSTNIGSIWQVADAAGVAAGNVVATLVGTIDLADTAWGTLTAANFA